MLRIQYLVQFSFVTLNEFDHDQKETVDASKKESSFIRTFELSRLRFFDTIQIEFIFDVRSTVFKTLDCDCIIVTFDKIVDDLYKFFLLVLFFQKRR